MLFEVLSDYMNDDPDPIELTIGDTVSVCEESDPNGPYPNWIFCVSDKSGRKGWVAKHVLSIKDGTGLALENYTSKEMAVIAGDKVEAVNELNGWFWCIRKADDETGWVAVDNLKHIV